MLAHRIQGLSDAYDKYVSMREQENKEDADNRYRNQLAVVSTKGAAVMVKTSVLNARGQWHEHDTLLDSGALGSSYVSQQWVTENPEAVLDRREINFEVKFGDSRTKQALTEEVRVRMALVDTRGNRHEAHIWCKVLDTGLKLIVGLPDLLDYFLEGFIEILRAGAEDRARTRYRKDKLVGVTVDDVNFNVRGFSSIHEYQRYCRDNLLYNFDSGEGISSMVDDEPERSRDLVEAWQSGLEEAPEERDLPTPVQFEAEQAYMAGTREEAIEKYFDALEKHVSLTMREKTDITKLMKTKGVDVFVPNGEWKGLTGLEGLYPDGYLELNWKEDEIRDLRIKVRARAVNPKLFDNVEREFERMRGYFYVPSSSPIASPLVIAPKSTHPYIRFCGDYVRVNKLIDCPSGAIVNVRDAITRISGFTHYGEFDMMNGFHQIPIGPITRARLSVVTPFGQYEPQFLPEGVSPASIELQNIVRHIFSDMDYVIALFDNLLIGAYSEQDLYEKINKFLDRCKKHNLVLKITKSNIGFEEVEFFGYRIKKDFYELTDDRKEVLKDIPFPNSLKSMQKFLGFAIYFQPFVKDYATLAARLYQMTTKDFDWNPKEWKEDYESIFNEFKSALQNSQKLFYPDYSKKWILRTDASILGIGGVLLQEMEVEGRKELMPLFFVSKKFSPAAMKWSTIQQECYGIYYTVFKLQDHLRGKFFETECDHNNLRWMEASSNAAVTRMRIFLQQFITHIRHIAGKDNHAADYLSRTFDDKEMSAMMNMFQEEYNLMNNGYIETSKTESIELNCNALHSTNYKVAREYELSPEQYDLLVLACAEVAGSEDNEVNELNFMSAITRNQAKKEQVHDAMQNELPFAADFSDEEKEGKEATHTEGIVSQQAAESKPATLDTTEMLESVHNSRQGHWGAYRTWVRLRDSHPGNGIPFRVVQDFVQACPICQKVNRPMMDNKLESRYRTIKSLLFRKAIGIDHVTITPVSKDGYKGITVIVNMFSGEADLYPYKVSTGEHDARCLHDYFSRKGVFDEIRTDPGTDFKSKILECMEKWYGINHVFSITDRHESNGVERVIKEVIRHLSALVLSERIAEKWSEPEVIASIRLILNTTPLSERGNYAAYDLTYGVHDQPYFLFRHTKSKKVFSKVMQKITESMESVREASKEFQLEVAKKRGLGDKEHNQYQQGDYVLSISRKKMNSMKLMPRLHGPWEVISQYKNDVKAVHMATKEEDMFHVEELTLFIGDKDAAEAAALLDNDSFYIDSIMAHRGDPFHRTSMEFMIQWSDGEVKWDRWNTSKENFSKTVQFREYCNKYPELGRLLLTKEQEQENDRIVNQNGNIELKVGDTFFHDLESYGSEWYRKLKLPNTPEQRYYTVYEILEKPPGKSIAYIVRDKDLEGKDFEFRPVEFRNLVNRAIPTGGVRLSPQLITKHKIKIP